MFCLIFLLTILGLLWVWLAQWRIWRAHRFLLVSAQAPGRWRHNLALLPAFFLSTALLLSLLLYYWSIRQVPTFPEAPAQLFVLLDCSASMEAEAWLGVSRLETAKKLLCQLPDELPDWEFALLTFAGVPLLDFPPSNDYRSWLDALAVAVPDGYLLPGSSPGKALQMAKETIELCASEKALILLLSDGEINVENQREEKAYWRQRENPCLFLLQGAPGERKKIPGASAWLQTGNPAELAYSTAAEKEIRTCLGLSKSPFRILSGRKETEDISHISDEIWRLTKMHSENKLQNRGNVFPCGEREGLLLSAFCCLLAVFCS
ncbi:MAG: vWA domain-containing protein, partial [Lentisphaeria bacterium]